MASRKRRVLLVVVGLIGLLLLLAAFLAWMTAMPGRSHGPELPPLTSRESDLAERLRGHVTTLAGEIGVRNYQRPKELDAARAYVEERLRSFGYEPGRQEFTIAEGTFANVEVELPGSETPDQIVVFGAHYDSVIGCPGADDNASGVAGLLELARLRHGRDAGCTIRFVAFVNEEPPFFASSEMGSAFYAKRCRERGERIVAMFSIESIGYFADEPGSQRYPPPFSLMYPSTAGFIAFVGNLSSRSLVRRSIEVFRSSATVPSEGVAAPSLVPGIGWSDQLWFWRNGYPAVMVTDTAPFRNPTYHTPNDEPESLDYPRMARVVAGLDRVLDDLAGIR